MGLLRNFWRSQQRQRSLQESQTSERRVSVPAPVGANFRDSPHAMPASDAVLVEDLYNVDGGLAFCRKPRKTVLFSGSSDGSRFLGLIPYEGSGSTSAEMWAITRHSGTTIYNVGEVVEGTTTATASVAFTTTSSPGAISYDHVQFNNNILLANGSEARRWSRSTGWVNWSATASGVSGESSNIFWGVNKFKSRLFAWERNSTKFWYGSADQVIGTFNSFDLSTLVNGTIVSMSNMTRDGGAGPDDYAVFVTNQGETVVYQGNDPGDANNWSLVGVYKIGEPLGRKSFVKYGQQLVYLCTDDFYFLPNDLVGKRQSTKAVGDRPRRNQFTDVDVNAVHWEKENIIVFSDGSVLDPKKGFSYSDISLNNTRPHILRRADILSNEYINEIQLASRLAVFKGRLYSLTNVVPSSAGEARFDAIYEINHPVNYGVSTFHQGRIRTAPINTPGRTQIHLINPVILARPDDGSDTFFSASAPGKLNIKYRYAVVYDQAYEPYTSAQVAAWITASASGTTLGDWQSGFGYGDSAQIFVELLTATCSGEVIFQRLDFTVGDTGGL